MQEEDLEKKYMCLARYVLGMSQRRGEIFLKNFEAKNGGYALERLNTYIESEYQKQQEEKESARLAKDKAMTELRQWKQQQE